MSEQLFGFSQSAAGRLVKATKWFEANGMRIGGDGGARFPQSEKIAIIQLSGNTYTPPGGSAITLGGGRYGINIFKPSLADITLTGNLAQSDFGTTSRVGVGLNIWEVGASTHNLLTTAGTLPQIFIGFLVHVQKDRTPIYAFDGMQEGC